MKKIDEQSINKACNLILKELERILNLWKEAASKFQECDALIKVMYMYIIADFISFQ